MKLLDLDRLNQDTFTGKTAVVKFLEKYVNEHPVNEITVRQDDDYEVILRRKGTAP